MKKLTISFLAVIFSIGAALSQPISDQGIIPVGVTLNSILRLNITSGGNMEFVINTIDQYTTGIHNSAALPNPTYDTHFTVASSVDFDVTIASDGTLFYGVDNVANTIPLNNLGYLVDEDIGATGLHGTNWDLPTTVYGLTSSQVYVVGGNDPGLGAGSVLQNMFVIHWRLGTQEGGMLGQSLLNQSITSDRYVTNAVIELSQHTVAVVVP